MNLYHLKLSNGEELITELAATHDKEFYKLKNPLMLSDVVDQETGATAVILQEFAPFSNGKSHVQVSRTQVTAMYLVSGEMVGYYKASLQYAILFSTRETDSKVKNSTQHLQKYIQEKLDTVTKSLAVSESTIIPFVRPGVQEVTEEDIDEDLLDEMTSSNTSFH